MFFSDWFYRILAYLGLWQKKTRSLLLLLDYNGKEILSRMLRNEGLVQQDPTHLTTGKFSIENIEFTVLDLGDLQIARNTLRDYHVKVDAVAKMTSNSQILAPERFAFVVSGYHDSWPDEDDDDFWFVDGAVRKEELDVLLSKFLHEELFLMLVTFAESKGKPDVSMLLNSLLSKALVRQLEPRRGRYSRIGNNF